MAAKTAATSERKDSYLGKVVAGRYRLEARLGEGGMGIVYRARHVLIDRIVAIKLIRPDLREETHLRAWMLREAKAANRVDHAHIVEIHDVGETDERDVYLVMEYLVGSSLATEIGKGQMPIPRGVDILEQMSAALSRAHDLGVVHRDLKSDNIMLTNRGGRQDFVKILDFGLAALARDARLAPKGAVFGTPEYMSPEQARGEDATPASDLYALGVLFFEMTTGRLPFRSNDRETLLEMQRSAEPPKPRMLRPDLPKSAENIILKLLEKDARRRFRDGHHLQEELKALQRSLPAVPWDAKASELPQTPAAPPPPAPTTPGVAEWGRRAANFARMVARAHPNGSVPTEVRESSDRIWDLAARASRLEGELSSHSKQLEAIERRGRALRAEIGRKVEELAHEESRTLREGQGEREQASKIAQQLLDLEKRTEGARLRVDQLTAAGTSMSELRTAAEELGECRARVQSARDQGESHEARARDREAFARDLRAQIDGLRNQLQRYSEALESDLTSGRERISTRVREALEYEREFTEHSQALLNYLQGHAECADVLSEITRTPGSHHSGVSEEFTHESSRLPRH